MRGGPEEADLSKLSLEVTAKAATIFLTSRDPAEEGVPNHKGKMLQGSSHRHSP